MAKPDPSNKSKPKPGPKPKPKKPIVPTTAAPKGKSPADLPKPSIKVQPTKTAIPSEAAKSAKPGGASRYGKAIKVVQPSQPTLLLFADLTEPEKPSKSTKPTKPSKPAKPSPSAEPAKPAKPAEPAKSAKSAQAAESGKASKTAKSAKAGKTAESTKSAKPPKPPKPPKPGKPIPSAAWGSQTIWTNPPFDPSHMKVVWTDPPYHPSQVTVMSPTTQAAEAGAGTAAVKKAAKSGFWKTAAKVGLTRVLPAAAAAYTIYELADLLYEATYGKHRRADADILASVMSGSEYRDLASRLYWAERQNQTDQSAEELVRAIEMRNKRSEYRQLVELADILNQNRRAIMGAAVTAGPSFEELLAISGIGVGKPVGSGPPGPQDPYDPFDTTDEDEDDDTDVP